MGYFRSFKVKYILKVSVEKYSQYSWILSNNSQKKFLNVFPYLPSYIEDNFPFSSPVNIKKYFCEFFTKIDFCWSYLRILIKFLLIFIVDFPFYRTFLFFTLLKLWRTFYCSSYFFFAIKSKVKINFKIKQ